MDRNPPGSSVHGILQARILEQYAIPFSRGSSWPNVWTQEESMLSNCSVREDSWESFGQQGDQTSQL